MSTLKVRGENVDKVRELLGGANPTEARVAQLFEELDLRRRNENVKSNLERIQHLPPVVGHDDAEVTQALEEQEPAPAIEATGPGTPIVDYAKEQAPAAGVPPGGWTHDGEQLPRPEQEVVTAPAQIPAEPETIETRMLRLLEAQARVIESLESTVKELRAPKAAEDKERAIGDGKLPVTSVAAPPAGYTGSAQFPVGVWFPSPFGPKVEIKVCGCGACSPVRLYHFFCVMCRRGPIAYQGNNTIGGKSDYFAPGATWGVSHVTCSIVCWQRYQEVRGVVAGVNDHMPIGQADAKDQLPDPRAVPFGSD